MGVTPPHLRTTYNVVLSLRRVLWESENDGCESEFIVDHFENRICMCANVSATVHVLLCGVVMLGYQLTHRDIHAIEISYLSEMNNVVLIAVLYLP